MKRSLLNCSFIKTYKFDKINHKWKGDGKKGSENMESV